MYINAHTHTHTHTPRSSMTTEVYLPIGTYKFSYICIYDLICRVAVAAHAAGSYHRSRITLCSPSRYVFIYFIVVFVYYYRSTYICMLTYLQQLHIRRNVRLIKLTSLFASWYVYTRAHIHTPKTHASYIYFIYLHYNIVAFAPLYTVVAVIGFLFRPCP